jgi:hypothetical protein
MTKFTFYIDNDIAFQCNLETNRCIAHNKNNTRCKRRVAIGLPYCCIHLPTNLHLKIKPSTIPNAGKGLFAFDKTKGNDFIVFKKGQVICEYGGDLISVEECNRRYSEDHTAPYGIQLKNDTIQDCACNRGIGSIANTAERKRDNNAEFYIATRPTRQIKLKAKRNILNNTEIFVDYGNEYDIHEDNVHYKTR